MVCSLPSVSRSFRRRRRLIGPPRLTNTGPTTVVVVGWPDGVLAVLDDLTRQHGQLFQAPDELAGFSPDCLPLLRRVRGPAVQLVVATPRVYVRRQRSDEQPGVLDRQRHRQVHGPPHVLKVVVTLPWSLPGAAENRSYLLRGRRAPTAITAMSPSSRARGTTNARSPVTPPKAHVT